MKKLFENHTEESFIEDVQYWEDKMSQVTSFRLEKLKNSQGVLDIFTKKKKSKIKEKKDFEIFKFAPKSIMVNQDLMLKAINEGFVYYFKLPEELRESKDFAKKYLNEVNYAYYFNLSDNLLVDDEVFNLCLKKDPKTYQHALRYYIKFSNHITLEKTYEYLAVNPKIYEFIPNEYKKNLKLSQKAIELDFNNINFMKKNVSERIFNIKNRELAKTLIEKDIDLFVKVNNAFRNDEEFMSMVVKKRASFIEYASEDLRKKKSFVTLALSAYNLIEFIPDEFKKDTALMEKHLESNPSSIYELSKFIDVKPLMFNVISRSYYAYERLSEENKLDEDYIFAVLEHQDFYKKTDPIKNNPFSYSVGYEKASIIYILPEKIQEQLQNEMLEKFPNKSFSSMSQEEHAEELLSFARKKYVNIYMKKHINNSISEKKKFKI